MLFSKNISKNGTGRVLHVPGSGPVSYTHLDVYKRQEPVQFTGRVVHIRENGVFPGGDVYKRQFRT